MHMQNINNIPAEPAVNFDPNLQTSGGRAVHAPLEMLTDDLVQDLFLKDHANRFRISGRTWWKYHEGLWAKAEKAEVESALTNWMRGNIQDLIDKYGPPKDDKGQWTGAHHKLASHYSSATGMRNILRMAANLSSNHVEPSEFDPDKHLLNTPTFVFDLKTGQHLLHNPRFMMTRRTSVGPSRRATPVFDGFLNEVTQHDPALKPFLQCFAGYLLTGETREHKLLFLCGPGGNGKSVLLNVFRDIMGSYGKSSNSQVLMRGAEKRHTTEVAELVGVRAVTISELPSDGMWSQQRLTSLTGGDRLAARFMHGDNFEFNPQFKLMLAGNSRPVVQSPGDAFTRRMMFVNFPYKPTEPDEKLPEKLREEYGGILQWMIEGAVAYYRDGLAIPDSVLAATKEYAADEDDVSSWLEECCDRDVKDFTPMGDIFVAYSEWAKENGAREFKMRGLSERLAGLGFERERQRQVRGFIGLRLNSAY